MYYTIQYIEMMYNSKFSLFSHSSFLLDPSLTYAFMVSELSMDSIPLAFAPLDITNTNYNT